MERERERIEKDRAKEREKRKTGGIELKTEAESVLIFNMFFLLNFFSISINFV